MAASRVQRISSVLLLCAVLSMAQDQPSHAQQQKVMINGTNSDKHIEEIKLTVDTAKLVRSTGQWVTVSWQNVSNATATDRVALLVPAGADPTRTSPAKYQLASADIDGTHLTQGRGRLRFRLINYRSPVQFLFLRGNSTHPVLAARSTAVVPHNPNEPLQRRLALTGDNTQMLVQWTTRDSRSPVVKWGRKPGENTMWHTTAANSSTYTVHQMCGSPANSTGWIDPGIFHAALLTGLEPGALYHYMVGDEDWGFSPEASFRAAPPVGPDTTVKLVAVADMGQSEVDGSNPISGAHASLNTTDGIIADMHPAADYQLLVHYGDISYAYGYGSQWDNYHHQMEPIISRLPYMTVPGNHDRDWPGTGDRFTNAPESGGECGVPLEKRFIMPQAGPDKPWYSFDFGPIHFLHYSTEHDFRPGSEQHQFVLADLAAVNRRKTPWVVVGGHRPMYISSTNRIKEVGDQPVAAALREAFEQVFVKYMVDLTFHGHHHSYQRTCPVFEGKCQGFRPTISQLHRSHNTSARVSVRGERGGMNATYVDAVVPLHINIGNGGAALSRNVEKQPSIMWRTIKLWWGYLRVEASGSHFKCEAVSDYDGSVMDAVTLVKTASWMAKRVEAQQSLHVS